MVNKLSWVLQTLAVILSRLDDIRMTHPTSSPQARRADWLCVLARAPSAELARLAAPVLGEYRFEWLRAPEQGLMMVRARIGNTGDRFNLGEATVTRCAVRHRAASGEQVAGVGHVLGLDALRAERVAQLDALLQLESLHALLWRNVVEPLRECRAQIDRDERARTEASRVRFFTLQPEAA
jgi:alpha-D-ribose 1-methylphosphonate 5-triphosphate synthase subunit PhnG